MSDAITPMSAEDREAFTRGHAAQRAGDLESALAILRELAVRRPEDPDVLTFLGSLLIQRGDPAAAVDLLESVLAGHPERSDTLVNLGAAQRAVGDLAAAEATTRQVLEITGPSPGPLNNLGLTLQDLGRLDEAEAAFREALTLEPRSAFAWNSLGNLLERDARSAEAVDAYTKGLSYMPGHLQLLLNLGGTLNRLMRQEEALVVFRRALATAPDSAAAKGGEAFALHGLRQFDAADEAFAEALARDPEDRKIQVDYAQALQDRDRVEEALAFLEGHASTSATDTNAALLLAECYEKLNRLEESRSTLDAVSDRASDEPLYTLVDSKLRRRAGEAADCIAPLNRALERRDTPGWRSGLYYELGRCHEALKQSDLAFDAYTAANEIAREQWRVVRPGPNRFLEDLRAVRSTLDAAGDGLGWSELTDTPDDGVTAPVFLLGFARSGTTLLDQILDAHPSIQVLEERPMFYHLRMKLAAGAGGDHLAGLAELDEAGRTRLRREYSEEIAQELDRDPDKLFVDKLPMATANAHVIRRIFPESKIILAVRHPCDVVLSCFMQEFMLNAAMANFYSLEDASILYEETWGLWGQVTELFGTDHHRVRYEDLLADTEGQARGLLDFLGLPFDGAVLEFAEHARKRGRINTPSYHQVSQPIYTHARYRWQRYRQHLATSLDRLAPIAMAFDYPDPRTDPADT